MFPRVFVLLLLCGCAAQPQRDAPAVFTHGVASGDMRGDSAVLWTRTGDARHIVPQLARTPGFEAPVTLDAIDTRADDDFTARTLARGLQPGTRYYYRFIAGERSSEVGTFRTPYARDDDSPVRMAFSGDAHWAWKPYPIVDAINRENLDFFFFLGDLIYEDMEDDTAAEDLAGYRFKYRQNREPRENSPSGMAPLRELYATFGQYMVFDNHEIGVSAADKSAPPYTEGGARTAAGFVNQSRGFRDRIRAFVEYQPVRGDANRAPGDPRTDGTVRFYDAISWGANVELIILDDRSYRDRRMDAGTPSSASCDRTMLGATQLAWFERALLAAQRRGAVWKLVVISSPIQELGSTAQVGVDLDGFKGWAGNYRCERDRLLGFIDERAIDNVVFITTDYHFTSVNDLVYDSVPGDARSPRKRARNAFEIITGPIGAVTGSPLRSLVPFEGLPLEDAARRVIGDLNARMAKAGLDPIGLEADFPGLEADSIRAYGKPVAPGDPAAFSSIASYSYAVLTFGPTTLQVQVKVSPYVADPDVLRDAALEREYEARRATEAFSFTVRARAPGR